MASSGKAGRMAASKAIIEAAVAISNGVFPSDFDPNRIFSSRAVDLPHGVFNDTTGEIRSLDEIDLMYVLSLGKKGSRLLPLQYEFIGNELGESNPLHGKIDFLKKPELKLNANITGIKYRVFFSGEFISMLHQAMAGSGIRPRIEESNVAGVVKYSYGYATDIVGGSRISNVASYHGAAV